MEFKNVENKCHMIDGRPVWVSRSIAVVGVIFLKCKDTYHVLLEKRGDEVEDAPGKWVLPCGYLDYNETLSQACVREIWEETGLNVPELIKKSNVINEDFTVGDPAFTNSGFEDITNPRQNVSCYFVLNAEVKKLPKLTTKYNPVKNEVSELEWVPIDQIRKKDIGFNHENRIHLLKAYSNID